MRCGELPARTDIAILVPEARGPRHFAFMKFENRVDQCFLSFTGTQVLLRKLTDLTIDPEKCGKGSD